MCILFLSTGRIPSSVFTSDEYRSWLTRAPSTTAIYDRIRRGPGGQSGAATPVRGKAGGIRFTYSADNLTDRSRDVSELTVDKILIQIVDKILIQIVDKILIQIVDKILIQIVDKILIQIVDKILIQIVDKILIQIVDKILIQIVDKILIQIVDKILIQIVDKILIQIVDID